MIVLLADSLGSASECGMIQMSDPERVFCLLYLAAVIIINGMTVKTKAHHSSTTDAGVEV